MEQDVKFETLIIMAIAVFAALATVAFVIPFEDTDTRLFFMGVTAALTAINVIGLLMVWRSSPTVIDEVFLMTPTGLLLKHYTRRLRPDQDEDILAGMLTAVQNFVRDSFDEAGGRLNEIRFENYDILISHRKNVVVAAIISTKKPERLRNQLNNVTDDLELRFGDQIKNWSGDRAELGGVDAAMKRFLSGKYKSKPK